MFHLAMVLDVPRRVALVVFSLETMEALPTEFEAQVFFQDRQLISVMSYCLSAALC